MKPDRRYKTEWHLVVDLHNVAFPQTVRFLIQTSISFFSIHKSHKAAH